jgi:hypothetical protein
MISKVNADKITNKEVKIYVETAFYIMQECLLAAGRRGTGNPYNELAEMILEQFSGQTPDAKFLRNLNDKIKKLRDPAVPEKEMVIYNRNIFILSQVAGVPDYQVIKEKYSRLLAIPVLYTRRQWRIFTLIRIPAAGMLKQNRYQFEFRDDRGNTISGNVIKANPFTMPGDFKPLWVEIQYENNGVPAVAYFAEHENFSIIPVAKSDRVLTFFQKLAVIAGTHTVSL